MRVLLVTRDASLGVALAFEDPGRELVVVGSAAEARDHDLAGFDAAVVDIGSLVRGERAAEMFRDLGLARSIVIAEQPGSVADSDHRSYLARPFSITDLERALARSRHGLSQRTAAVPRRGLIGRFFETWTTTVHPHGDAGRPPAGREEGASGSVDPKAAVRTLPRRPDSDTRPSDGWRANEVRQNLALLESTSRLEELLSEKPHLSDLDDAAERASKAFSDGLLTSQVSIWMHASDGSHVHVPHTHAGASVQQPDRALFELLATAADAVLIDQLPHAWFGLLPDDVGEAGRLVAIAAALRTDDRYHGSVVALGAGFTDEDRDLLADLAREAAPTLALAATLNRLGVGSRLFSRTAAELVPR